MKELFGAGAAGVLDGLGVLPGPPFAVWARLRNGMGMLRSMHKKRRIPGTVYSFYLSRF
jgi:hypothetical protein